jgi:hypothetical protein
VRLESPRSCGSRHHSKWSVTDAKTADYTAAINELVRVDMSGKMAPDIVEITLPEATSANEGRSICVALTNVGGVEDGAILRITSTGGQEIEPVGTDSFDKFVGDVGYCFVSTGDRWTLLTS